MKTLLRDMTFRELAIMLERTKACSSVPHLVDPDAIERARRTAKRNGLWAQLSKDLDPAKEIPVLKRSLYRQLQRNGNRTRHQAVEAARSRELELAALALWLDHPRADLDYLQDVMWAYCDDWTWVMAAHEGCSIDLGSAMRGARLAEILYALGDRIEGEVADRVHAEIERRIFRNAVNYENVEFWHTARMNWNHVCNGAIVRAALLEIKNTSALARLLHPVIQNMTYALDGFTDDGGCEEGPGYWEFGFGHFVQAAYALYQRTDGELNIMVDEKVERICRFPLAPHIEGAERATFADCGKGAVGVMTALQINSFYKIPELYELCPRVDPSQRAAAAEDTRYLHKRQSDRLSGPGALDPRDMHSLALFRGEKAKGKPDTKDYVLPDLGMVKLRGKLGKDQMTVAALAGNNGVPHNHNDIGSLIVYKNGRAAITDPGGPLYNYDTFREKRYEILWCRSKGHSVPIINGREQEFGAQYRGELVVDGLNQEGIKTATIDMSKAYPKGTLKTLVRTLALDAESNQLTITDAFEFSKKPQSLDEGFVTFEKVVVAKDGKSVRIGPARGGAVLSTEQVGKFKVETLVEEPKHTKPGTPPLQRITFEPETLSKSFELRFTLS